MRVCSCALPSLLAVLQLPIQCRGNVVVNGFFSDGQVVGVGTYSTRQLPGWEVTSNNIDIVPSTTIATYAGDFSVDLNGLDRGTIEQTVLTTPGATYTLRWGISANPSARAGVPYAVLWNGKVVHEESVAFSPARNATHMMWQRRLLQLVATNSTSRLAFSSLLFGAEGPQLSDVSLDASWLEMLFLQGPGSSGSSLIAVLVLAIGAAAGLYSWRRSRPLPLRCRRWKLTRLPWLKLGHSGQAPPAAE